MPAVQESDYVNKNSLDEELDQIREAVAERLANDGEIAAGHLLVDLLADFVLDPLLVRVLRSVVLSPPGVSGAPHKDTLRDAIRLYRLVDRHSLLGISKTKHMRNLADELHISFSTLENRLKEAEAHFEQMSDDGYASAFMRGAREHHNRDDSFSLEDVLDDPEEDRVFFEKRAKFEAKRNAD